MAKYKASINAIPVVALACLIPIKASAFSASFQWCSKAPQSTTSPAFTLRDVPKGTVSLSLKMFDHQASYNHGGGEVPYTGKSVPCGAIAFGWVGPFPPEGAVHIYEFIVEALDSSRHVLGKTSATRKFPE